MKTEWFDVLSESLDFHLISKAIENAYSELKKDGTKNHALYDLIEAKENLQSAMKHVKQLRYE